MYGFRLAFALLAGTLCLGGCAAIPEIAREPQFHNPFPQLMRVAVLPFYNQSGEPTLNGDEVAIAYHHELQKVDGFEVMPVGTAKQLLAASGIQPQTSEDFQKLGRFMGVDAVVIGSVTDFTEYYPPRMGLAVNWYASNPCFHPIPPGYGLPWGTAEEEFIPPALVHEAEFTLAREQLKTQTPELPAELLDRLPGPEMAPQTGPQSGPQSGSPAGELPAREASYRQPAEAPGNAPVDPAADGLTATPPQSAEHASAASELPSDWPDPRGFVPPQPGAHKPVCKPHYGPIISQVRQYDGADGRFTEALAGYFHFRDDARFGGWQGYLQRKDDFYRFCCYMHITEMLAARGGVDETQLAFRWPFGRYVD